MRTHQPAPRLDHRIADLATRQHGSVSREQLRSLGATESEIDHRIAAGRLHPLTPGIYAVGHRALNRRGRLNAALLHLGADTCAVSHVSAARAWEIVRPSQDGTLHVSVLDRRDIILPANVKLHRPTTLTPRDIVIKHHVPVTTPERTLQDLLPSSSTTQITRMLELMVTVVGRSPEQLHAWAHQLKHVSGKKKLESALDYVVSPTVLRSELETQFRSLCQSQGLPLPLTNQRIGGWEVDALWVHHNVIVELDSYRFHGGRWQFHVDRRKGLELAALGYEVLRLTWPQVKYEQREVGNMLGRILTRRAPVSAPVR